MQMPEGTCFMILWMQRSKTIKIPEPWGWLSELGACLSNTGLELGFPAPTEKAAWRCTPWAGGAETGGSLEHLDQPV